jgi:hypothetical protein
MELNNCVLNCRVSVSGVVLILIQSSIQLFIVNAKHFYFLRERALVQHARMTVLNSVRAKV